MAVRVVVRLQAKPGEGDRLVEIVKRITPDSVAQDGAGAFELIRDLEDPDTVLVMERWRDRASHESYMKWRAESEAGQEGGRELFAVLGADPVIAYYETLAEWQGAWS
jgi:quinol monooxygenase YgiN